MPHDDPSAIDLRALDPPLPMVQIFESLASYRGGELRFLLRMEPRPIYRHLERQGFSHRLDGGAEGFELVVWRRDAAIT